MNTATAWKARPRPSTPACCWTSLEATILLVGPEKVIGFCAEPVVGATGGAIPPTPDYFRGVRALCDKYGILFIADEVMCGMGRTGTMFAIEQDGVAPDLIAVAKGLGAGYQPVGAVLANGAIVERLRGGSGAFLHGHTYIGHPVAAAAALAVQQVIERDDLLEPGAEARRDAAAHAGRRLRRPPARGRHPRARAVPGAGTGARPRDQGAVRAGAEAACGDQAAGDAAGLDGVSDGRDDRRPRGDHVLLAPPFIVTGGVVGDCAEGGFVTRLSRGSIPSFPADRDFPRRRESMPVQKSVVGSNCNLENGFWYSVWIPAFAGMTVSLFTPSKTPPLPAAAPPARQSPSAACPPSSGSAAACAPGPRPAACRW
jgi:adenosylmethionine-8-amino-7-oxononanoate aminotransferase